MIDAPQEIINSIKRIKITATPELLQAAAKARGWQVINTDDERLVYLQPPSGKKYPIFGVNTILNSYMGTVLATSKYLSTLIVEDIAPELLIPTLVVESFNQQAIDFLAQHKKVVVKPDSGTQGQGITLGIESPELLKTVLERDFAAGTPKLLLQKQVEGKDLRILVIGGKAVAAVRREPAKVIGDGEHTVDELITIKNSIPRTKDYMGTLAEIPKDEAAQYLGAKLGTVPARGEEVQVGGVTNVSRGGESHDETDNIPASLAEVVVSIAKRAGLGIMGADFLIPESGGKLDVSQAVLLEFNSQPGIRMHHYPRAGKPRDVAGIILDELEKH